jgi:beta-phosphoglucomutase
MKGIIYDMDGVIVLTEDVHKKAFDETMKSYNIKSSDIDWDNRFIGKGNLYILTSVFSDFFISENVREFADKWAVNYQELVRDNGISIVPGFIKYTNSVNCKKIVATGGFRKNAEIILNRLNLDYEIVSLEDLVNPKPDPEIFIKAVKKMDLSPTDCVVFEDSIFGIQAAKRAGVCVIALTTTHTREELSKENPDLIINDFNDLLTKTVYPQFDER